MNTKQLLILLACCTLSSLLSVGIYRYVADTPRVNVLDPLDLPDYLSSTTITPPGSFTLAAARTTPSVVYIRTFYGKSSRWEPNAAATNGSGSGVIIDPNGLIATNHHVIEGADRIKVILADQQEYSADVIGVDPTTDLALLRVDATDLPSLPFGNSDSLKVGEWVLAVGNPFNLASTVTAGIVSAKGRSIDVLDGEDRIESFIQTDAAVNPGNSGGALINERGELVGINTAIMTNSGRHEGFAFAIPGNLARRILKDLRDYGEVERALIGVYVQRINAAQAERLGLENVKGALVTRLRPEGAAADAGLEVGDVILNINDFSVTSPAEVQEQISKYRPGDRVTVTFIRSEKEAEVTIILRDKDNRARTRRLVRHANRDVLREIGLDLRTLTATEKNQLGGTGVKVTAVREESLAATTNMRAGYIITAIDDIRVSNPGAVILQLQNAEGEVTLKGRYEGYERAYYYRFNPHPQ